MGCVSSRNPPKKGSTVKTTDLFVPELKELAGMLKTALEKNFETVETAVVKCPDLKKWGLAASGICGDPRIADVGGIPNIMDYEHHKEVFHIPTIASQCDLPGAYVFGAGAASSKVVGQNAELMPTEHVKACCRKSKYAKVLEDGSSTMEDYHSSDFGLMANLVACKGEQGDVVMVRAKVRKGKENFVTCMRRGLLNILEDTKSQYHIGIGGVFKVLKGKINAHVMPDFKKEYKIGEPGWTDDRNIHYEMGPDLTCMSIFVTGDPSITEENPYGLDLRLEHTHFFSQSKKEGGHYHFDTTPKEVEYLAYFIPVPKLYRIDNPYPRDRKKKAAAAKIANETSGEEI